MLRLLIRLILPRSRRCVRLLFGRLRLILLRLGGNRFRVGLQLRRWVGLRLRLHRSLIWLVFSRAADQYGSEQPAASDAESTEQVAPSESALERVPECHAQLPNASVAAMFGIDSIRDAPLRTRPAGERR